MSTAELDESWLPEGVFHLLTADTDVASTDGGYVALCGAVMLASGLPPSCYPEVGPGRAPRYCPECVREAVRWSAEAGDRQAPPDAASSGNAAGVPDPGVQDDGVQDDDGEVARYFVGDCGHPAPLVDPVWRVGLCNDCDAEPGTTPAGITDSDDPWIGQPSRPATTR